MGFGAYNYDEGEKDFEPIHVKTIENIRKYLNLDDYVLDYGCGTGTKAFELAGDVKKVYRIDVSSKMIEIAKRKTIERKTQNLDFAQVTHQRTGIAYLDKRLPWLLLGKGKDVNQTLLAEISSNNC